MHIEVPAAAVQASLKSCLQGNRELGGILKLSVDVESSFSPRTVDLHIRCKVGEAHTNAIPLMVNG